MEVRVKLMGLLRAKAPADEKLEVPDGATVADILRVLQIPADHIHLVMINGQQERDRSRPLAANDELMILPPVAGG